MLLTVRQTAERLNVSDGCVYRLVADRKLAHVRIGVGRGVIRIEEEDLEAFVSDLRMAADGCRSVERTAPRPRILSAVSLEEINL